MTSCRFELLFQPFVLAPQTIAFDLRAPQIFAEPFNFSRLILDDPLQVARRRIQQGYLFSGSVAVDPQFPLVLRA